MKRMLGLGQRCGLSSRRFSQVGTEVNPSAIEQEIVIPKRIPRGPTDILRALESTIHKDPTAPEYKFIDDPYFIPAFNFEKRSFALAKESGRSAARYMLENFPECFKNNPAEPDVPHFNPPRPAFEANQEITEKNLLLCIEELDLTQGLVVYENLESRGVEIAQETLLKLLQMVSFYNGTPTPDSRLVEERYFLRAANKAVNSWHAGGLAERIFEKIQNKDSVAYSALIAGMLRYFDVERAFRLYEEMRSKNLVPTVHVYNHLIVNVRRMKDSPETRMELFDLLVNEMRDLGVQPNLSTFNNMLFTCSRAFQGKKLCSKILAEMEFLGIEPSLASYNNLLQALYRPRSVTHCLSDIMDRVSGKTWEIRDPKDLSFLLTAVETLFEYEPDKDLLYKLLDLAERNPHLLSNAYTESVFFQYFFRLLALVEDIDKFMLVYHRFVPNTYSPEQAVMAEILQAIELKCAHRYLPQLWSDILLMRLYERDPILKKMLTLTAQVERGTTKEAASLQQQCVVIARDIQTRVAEINTERDRSFRLPIVIDAEMVCNMLQTYLNADNLEYASETLKYLINNQKITPGYPPTTVLKRLAEKACEARDKPMAMDCVRYCAEIGDETIVDFVKEQALKQDFGDDFLRELGEHRQAI